MPSYTRTVEQKLKTKLSHIDPTGKVQLTPRQAKVGQRILFKYSQTEINYSKVRYFPTLKDDVKEEDFSVTILLNQQTINILSTSSIWNPPRGAGQVLDIVRHLVPNLTKIVIGKEENRIIENTLYITLELYNILLSINKEESKDKVVRVRNRTAPFLNDSYGLETDIESTDRDYSLLLQEIVASGTFTQNDIVALTNRLESGEQNEIVIERQINKQAEWLIQAIQTIIDEPIITKAKAQQLGYEIFSFPKTSITGPEHLMEIILSKYGQNIIFGVPALLNTDKYVLSATGLPRSQFDILLINHLSDVEIVELKRPDKYLLDYDSDRAKFYMSEDLAIATAQSERYISALYKEHDPDFTVDGVTIREFIQAEVGGTIILSICRPRALVVMGTIQRVVKPYDELPVRIKNKITKVEYNQNSEIAYREIKASFKNIDIVTYTELIEGARLRLQLIED